MKTTINQNGVTYCTEFTCEIPEIDAKEVRRGLLLCAWMWQLTYWHTGARQKSQLLQVPMR